MCKFRIVLCVFLFGWAPNVHGSDEPKNEIEAIAPVKDKWVDRIEKRIEEERNKAEVWIANYVEKTVKEVTEGSGVLETAKQIQVDSKRDEFTSKYLQSITPVLQLVKDRIDQYEQLQEQEPTDDKKNAKASIRRDVAHLLQTLPQRRAPQVVNEDEFISFRKDLRTIIQDSTSHTQDSMQQTPGYSNAFSLVMQKRYQEQEDAAKISEQYETSRTAEEKKKKEKKEWHKKMAKALFDSDDN